MDKHKRAVTKVKLKKIIKNDVSYLDLHRVISDTNKIINIGYLFTRSFFLHAFENINSKKYKDIFDIQFNIDFIRRAFSVLSCDDKPKKGRPLDIKKDDPLIMLQNYYKIFNVETKIDSLNSTNLSYVLGQTYKQIYIVVINNITYHFDKHLWQYIKANFNNKYTKIREQKDKEKLKEFWSELGEVKTDLLENTFKSHKKYHKWIAKKRSLVIPVTYTEKQFERDVKDNTLTYLYCMWNMNKFIQTTELKSYQVFPIRSTCYQNYIKINTQALIDIFCKGNSDETKLELFSKAGNIEFQEEIWNKYFNLKNSNNNYKYTRKGFSFNYEIETDGYAVSLNLINNNEIQNKETKKLNFRKARKKTNEKKKDLSSDEYDTYLKEKQENTNKKEDEYKQLQKEIQKEKKEEFKNLPEEEQEKIKIKLNNKSEFPYIEKLLKDKKNKEIFEKDYNDGKVLLIDPGKKSILYLMASNNVIHKKEKNLSMNNFGISIWKNHKIMNYTNKTRLKFLKRNDYSKLVESWKSNTTKEKFIYNIDIKEDMFKKNINDKEIQEFLKKELDLEKKSLKNIETELSNFNKKSCIYEDFINYVKKKIEYDKKVSNQYDTEYLQKLKWYSYLNKRRHEDTLLNHIENEFGKDITIVIGDYSGKGQLKFISTPNLSLKRKLAERFKVYLIDEYLTSKIHYKHHVRCENLYVKMGPNENPKKLHSVLSYKIENQDSESNKLEMGCIDRDKNSVLNMETIVKSLLKTGKRPAVFSRSKKQSVKPEEQVSGVINSMLRAHIGNKQKDPKVKKSKIEKESKSKVKKENKPKDKISKKNIS